MRVIWATNLAAPYRLPVWAELSKLCDLEVWLLSENEHNRRWSAPRRDYGFRHRVIPTIKLRWREDTYYAIARRQRGSPSALILPAWNQPAAWQLLHWAKKQSVATLAFNESTLSSRRHRRGSADRLRRRFHERVAHILTVSPASTEAMLQSGVEPARISECPNAVDLDLFASARSQASVDLPHTFIFCGQLIERKRPDLAIEALARMRDTSTQLIVVGEGPLEERLHRHATSLGIGRRTEFTGYLEPGELPAVFGRAHTLVMPSEQEVHGLVAAEALASGMHALVSQHAGVTSIIRGMRGYYPITPDIESVTHAMNLSQQEWTGRISEPAILTHGPRQMATAVMAGIRKAVRSHGVEATCSDGGSNR